MNGGRRDPIVIVRYRAERPYLFAVHRGRVAEALRPWLAGPVEHIGSTAVPGLAAKPIIDMMTTIESFESFETPGLPAALAAIGWVAAPEPGDTATRKCTTLRGL